MIVIHRRQLVVWLMLFLFVLGLVAGIRSYRPKVNLGERKIPINPWAKIDPKQQYQLTVWDYNWPQREGGQSYRQYLSEAVAEFRQLYPNIRIQLKLLDLLEGPALLNQALKNGNLPDLYCSAYQLPKFDYRWQIPVGPFLKPEQRAVWDPALLEMTKIAGVQCYYPRWVSPLVWAGNRNLLEQAGLPVTEIQRQGWTWGSLTKVFESKLSRHRFVGIAGDAGFLSQLICQSTALSSQGGKPNPQMVLEIFDGLVAAKRIPKDYAGNAIGRFLAGEAPVLAGIRLGVYRKVQEKLAEKKATWEAVLLPGPYLQGGREILPVENGVICVYRNRRGRGDDQIMAAVRLGYFLSTYHNTQPWRELMVYPAALRPSQEWQAAQPGPTGDRTVLPELFRRAMLVNCDRPSGESRSYQIYHEYFIGQKTREEAVRELEGL